jgi:hypothetical protein
MRLGARRTVLQTMNCITAKLYQREHYIDERHRHRWGGGGWAAGKKRGAARLRRVRATAGAARRVPAGARMGTTAAAHGFLPHPTATPHPNQVRGQPRARAQAGGGRPHLRGQGRDRCAPCAAPRRPPARPLTLSVAAPPTGASIHKQRLEASAAEAHPLLPPPPPPPPPPPRAAGWAG